MFTRHELLLRSLFYRRWWVCLTWAPHCTPLDYPCQQHHQMFDVDTHDARTLQQWSTITTFRQWWWLPTTTTTAAMHPHHPWMVMTANIGCWRALVSPSTSGARGVSNVRYCSNPKGQRALITSIDNAGELSYCFPPIPIILHTTQVPHHP